MHQNPQPNSLKSKHPHQTTFSNLTKKKPFNRTHCQSLIDLQAMEKKQISKDNSNTHHHNLSEISNQDYNYQNNKKLNFSHINSTKPTLSNSKKLYNITKILLNIHNSKQKQNLNTHKSNPMFQVINAQSITQKITNADTTQSSKINLLPHALKINHHKKQILTSPHPLIDNLSLISRNSSNQKYLSNKCLKKQTTDPIQFQKYISHRKQQQTKQSQHNNIIGKLKKYINNLKQNQHQHFSHIKQLSQQLTHIKSQSTHLKDKLQAYETRQQQLSKNLKNQQQLITNLKLTQHKTNNSHNKYLQNNSYYQHQLLIQNLKNVIHQQMNKIIQLQNNKIQTQQKSKNNYKSKQNLKKNNLNNQKSNTNDNSKHQYKQPYSFKKKTYKTQQNIYKNQKKQPQNITKISQTKQQKQQKHTKSFTTFSQPSHQFIKNLQSNQKLLIKNIFQQSLNSPNINLESHHQLLQHINHQKSNKQPLSYRQQNHENRMVQPEGLKIFQSNEENNPDIQKNLINS